MAIRGVQMQKSKLFSLIIVNYYCDSTYSPGDPLLSLIPTIPLSPTIPYGQLSPLIPVSFHSLFSFHSILPLIPLESSSSISPLHHGN